MIRKDRKTKKTVLNLNVSSVVHKLITNTALRNRFIDEFIKIMSLIVKIKAIADLSPIFIIFY